MSHKAVLVIGASRDIDRAMTVGFAKKGCNMAISCIHRGEQPMQTRREIGSLQIPCPAYKGDTGDMAYREELFLKTKKMFGGMDVLVNNAGISYIGFFQDMTPANQERMLRTDLTSVFNCRKLAAPYMASQRQGKIVNISSVWGVVGVSRETAHSTTKGGINVLTKALAKELASNNTQVNVITCGVIDTGVNQWMDEDDLIALVNETPSGCLGRVEEVADLAYHLGYKGSYLAGRVIRLDGGWI